MEKVSALYAREEYKNRLRVEAGSKALPQPEDKEQEPRYRRGAQLLPPIGRPADKPPNKST